MSAQMIGQTKCRQLLVMSSFLLAEVLQPTKYSEYYILTVDANEPFLVCFQYIKLEMLISLCYFKFENKLEIVSVDINFNSIISRKYLFERFEDFQCYELTKRCSHLPFYHICWLHH